jgi:hypothetical protein
MAIALVGRGKPPHCGACVREAWSTSRPGAARGFRVPDRLVKRIVFMHVEYVAHPFGLLAVYPHRVNYPGVVQAAFFVLFENLKDRMRYSVRVVPNLSFTEIHSYASFVLIRHE